MIISIASGKGGTGKTTIATNMALALGSDVQLLDCDVEEPNAHLFLKPEIESTTPVYVSVPVVETSRCTGCEKCAEICRFNAITVVQKTVLTFPELCHDCGGCYLVCPEHAILKSQRELGSISKGHRNGITFYHGKLRIGEAMSPPLIKEVKQQVNSRNITIIDAPPGTSCPVITAMKDSDFILLVTEPTPFGLHDLQLAVEAVKTLAIPCGLIINRSDIGDDAVQDYAKAEKIPILMEIPFDRHIAELYSKGELITEHDNEWREAFKSLYTAIESIIHTGSHYEGTGYHQR